MKTKKEIVPEITIFYPYSKEGEKFIYHLPVPISESSAILVIRLIESDGKNRFYVEERKAAFKIMGKKAASLTQRLFSHEWIYRVEMYKKMIVIETRGRELVSRERWGQFDEFVTGEILEIYKKMKIKNVLVIPQSSGHGEVSG